MTPDAQNHRLTLKALRNFFLARQEADLAVSGRDLIAALGEDPAVKTNWAEVESVFNRLFVGPKALEAPPYASVYLEPEGLIMGETTILVRRIYEMLGLSVPDQGVWPDDHISFELDACLAFKTALAERPDIPELKALWRFFLERHLAVWLPQFVARIKSTPNLPPVIGLAANALTVWLEEEKAALIGRGGDNKLL